MSDININVDQSKLLEYEREWREHIKSTLQRLETGQESITTDIATMKRENEIQHTEMQASIEILVAKYEAELRRSNDSLLGRNKLVRTLLIVILVLSGIIAEAKLHVSSFLKLLGFGS